MATGYEIQGRDAFTGGAGGTALGGSLGVYIQGITTGNAVSSLNGVTSPTQNATNLPQQSNTLPIGVGGPGGVVTQPTAGLATSSSSSLLMLAVLAVLALQLLKR